MSAAKIAVTVPRATFAAVEKRRHVLGVTRSAVVAAALEAWLADQSMTAEERKYLLAYLRQPETRGESTESNAVAKAAVSAWEPWGSGAPRKRRPAREER